MPCQGDVPLTLKLLSAGLKTGSSFNKHEALALLLPAAKAYLQHLPKPAVHLPRAQQLPQNGLPAAAPAAMSASESARRVTDDDKMAASSTSDSVRAAFGAEMVEYMTAKAKTPQGVSRSSTCMTWQI